MRLLSPVLAALPDTGQLQERQLTPSQLATAADFSNPLKGDYLARVSPSGCAISHARLLHCVSAA
jgi:hypothetical protein